jgi:hypothetical protein
MKRNTSLSMCALALCCMLVLAGTVSAQVNAPQAGVLTNSQFNRPIQFAELPSLRDAAAKTPVQVFGFHQASPTLNPKLIKQLQFGAQRGITTSTLTNNANVQNLAAVQASVGVNVLGVGIGFFGYAVPDAPTDVNLAVGDTQVVQWVNVQFAVFNKTTGAVIPVAGNNYTSGNALWSALGGTCAANNDGDIIAQWDKMAHRWVMFQPVFAGPYAGCFAISKTPDFLGGWYLYAYSMGSTNFPDYPKIGIQQDAYYQSQNIFNAAGTAYLGVMPCAYNRAKMLAGDPTAEQVCTLDTSNGTLFDDGFIPADLDSPELPLPAGTPEVYLGSIDNFSSETRVYEYTYLPNFTAGTAVLTGVNGANPISVASLGAYVGLCNFGSTACVRQLGTTSRLDSLGDRLMYRLALRRTVNRANVPVNHWLISHSIVAGTTGAERWYEFRSPNNNLTGLSLYQGGTYAPDASYRFMGSIAMDKAGDIAIGYSRSSTTLHPDIYFTGQSASASGTGVLDGELPIVNQTVATGAQSGTSNRWGDYTSMAVDNDGCTMWYTNQYYTTVATFHWSTRVASLKFGACTPWNPVP